jgi:RNA polymerase sigma factor for flagellar operon FliA
VRDKAKRVRLALEDLEQRLGRAASESEVAAELKISLEEYWGLLDEIRPVSFVPLDEELSGEGVMEGSVHERVADQTMECPREELERAELHRLLVEQIGKMPELPKKVLAMYYFENMRLSEIAAVFHLTEGRISQIHTQAVLNLRNFLRRLNNPILCS